MVSNEMENLKKTMKEMMKKGFAPKFDGSADPLQLRRVIQFAQENMEVIEGIEFEELKNPVMDIEVANPKFNYKDDAVIIYIHGGGFVCGNAKSSRGYAAMIANESGYPVYSFTYSLAPEFPFPAALNDCFEAYKIIKKENPNKRIFLVGESAGANLSIVTALKVRDTGLEMPNGVVAYSPIIDCSGVIDRDREENKDFIVTLDTLPWVREVYCSKEESDVENPYCSPYYDDFHNMCPMFLAWDESETLAVDSEILVEKLKNEDISVEYYSYPDCFHAFATTGYGTPESYDVLKKTVQFFDKISG